MWTNRLFLLDKTELAADVLRWRQAPDGHAAAPLRDGTRFPFALLQSGGRGPTFGQLCVWVGGRDGAYRILRLGLEYNKSE